MADDLLFAVQAIQTPTRNEIEAAATRIGHASFKKIEKLLGLSAPDIELRSRIVEAVVLYRRWPDPAASERRDLKVIRKYFFDVLQHLKALQARLPEGNHDLVQSNFLLRVLEQGTKTRRRFEGRDYLSFRSALNDFTEATQAASVELTKKRVPPNLSLAAEKWLVWQLAEIFQERTGRNPRDHVKSNYDKSKYRGTFFEIADEVLQRVGHQQVNTTRGRMILAVLLPKTSRPV